MQLKESKIHLMEMAAVNSRVSTRKNQKQMKLEAMEGDCNA
jgi:hypothetical protein